ncbi:MAG: hypothetical protein GX594_09845 [Pirellulaceae bacterium]|nr:hypothetical protein [Pirellulaceae bacterium]
MNGKRIFRLFAGIFTFGLVCSTAAAAPFWNNLISANRVEADPEQIYSIGEENGPWMVMACSFSGEGAERQANELVQELRKRYKLPAYAYRAKFDLGEAEGRGIDRYGNPIKWQYQKFANKSKAQIDEVAVLVGNFASADDPAAQAALRKIKFARPQCLEIEEGKKTNQTLTGWRMIQRQVYEAVGSEKKKRGPMGHAFVTTNPLLPPDYFVPTGIDPIVLALNDGVPYSLLDCPGKYSVQVATFKGKVILKQEEIRRIENGQAEINSELAAAAMKADQLTRALRMKGYEAYQFHDRNASIVTVGSFNSVGTPRQDGKIEIDPRVHRIIQIFGPDPEKTSSVQNALKTQRTTTNALGTPVKELIGIPFDIQPIPVEAPKRSISHALR